MAEAVSRSRVGAMTYLAPAVTLNSKETVHELQQAFDACFAAHQVQLVLDLSQIQLINGAALDVMLDAHAKLTTLGGRLKVVNPNSLIKLIFYATGFSDFVPVVDALSGAETARVNPNIRSKKKLGDILVELGLLKAEQMSEAIQLQKQKGKRLGEILIERNMVSEQDLMRALSAQFGVPFIDLRAGIVDPATLSLIDKATAKRLEVLPLFCMQGKLTLASTDPLSIPISDEIEKITGKKARLVLARGEDITKFWHEAYSGIVSNTDFLDSAESDLEIIESQIPDDYTQIDEMAGESPVINLVNSVIQRAIRDKASDIHIETSRTKSRVRFRIDGVMYEVMTPRAELHPAIVSRLKVMANLDIAERRLPQDGRIQVATQGRTVDLRFSSLPGIFGEKVVLRVLDKNQSILDVDKLGMADKNVSGFKRQLARSHGLILVTGPTGSGKTTTLYAAINHLKSIEKNIVTIEDPVEYQLDIINQNQVNEAVGLNFAKMLKHILRQDPDIIMVGEIRDRETAEIAVQSALTGHLVLSTLHTNDAVGAISRLIEMEVEPYLLSSALIGIVAQRLVRSVCGACKTSYLAPPEIVAKHQWNADDNIQLVRGRGCPTCYDSGYKGRIGIHELLEIDETMQKMIIANASRDQLLAHAATHGHKDLYADGVARALKGHTTLEEVSRVIHTM
jgi:type IV pilus assembly protein PilB